LQKIKNMKRLMPYGSANFEKIATGNYYYIDKTMYIEKLENVEFPVFLRPRRFGKSLFTETLRCYYDLNMKNRFNEIFGKLHIGKNPTGNQNKYFFLSLDFSGMYAYAELSELELKKSFDRHISSTLFGFLLRYKEIFNLNDDKIFEYQNKFENDAASGVATICDFVSGVQGKLFIVIDEYDSLTNALAIRYRHTNADDNMYLNILGKGGFFRNFFEMLKANTKNVIHQIYITGILPITISDMKSGFNIAKWIHFNPLFSNMLGITKSEFDNFVDDVYYDYPEIKFDKDKIKNIVKNNYNGYKFTQHGEEIYNPMMTLYFLDSLTQNNIIPDLLADYNLRISYEQIAFLFGQNLEEAKRIITEITEHKTYRQNTMLQVSFDMKDFKEGNYIAEGLFYAGILTYSEKEDVLKIPNLVTYGFTLEYFNKLQNFDYKFPLYSKWISPYKDFAKVEILVKGFFDDVIQKYPGQFFSNVNESFYHGLFYQVLNSNTPRDKYELLPEFNVPTGRIDIFLRTYPNTKVAIPISDIFEIKQVGKTATDAELNTKFEEAKAQVLKYKTADYQNFRLIAICFRGNLDFKMEVFC